MTGVQTCALPIDAASPPVTGGIADSSVPPPPAPHAVPRRAVRPTPVGFDINDGDYEEVSGGTETITRRVEELEKVSVLKFPTVPNVRQWHNGVARRLVLASGRTDQREIQWINEVLKAGAKMEDFADSGEPRFATLDIKLYAAVLAVIRDGNRTLATKVIGLEDAARSKGA